MMLLGWRLDAERWALLSLQRLALRLGRTNKKARHLVTGERGELEALFYLRRLGYLFVERRWRSPELNGDVDLIGWDGETLCFVEVKARTARDFAPAKSAVDEQKQRMLRRMGRAYLRTLPRGERNAITPRFDVVSVYLVGDLVECELVRHAFPWPAGRAAAGL
jgi:putative endonuclease